MSEDEVHIIDTDLKTKGDKARAIAKMGQQMLNEGFTHTQASDVATHEIKHALEDPREGQVSLKKRGRLTIPTYSSLGYRTPEEKEKIALAPDNPSPRDLKIAEEAKKIKESKQAS